MFIIQNHRGTDFFYLFFSFNFFFNRQCVRSDSHESMADVTSLGNLPYIPAASDVSDMMGHAQNIPQQQQQQQQQMLNHQTNNNNGGNLMGLSMDVMHQQQPQQPPTHSHQQSMNIKQDYGLTAL